MTHTPGPWKVLGDTTVIRDQGDVVGEVICEVEDTSAFVQNEEQLAANARLIAAAPDLLTALKAFVDKHDGERWLLGPQLERCLPAMRAAITKAEGPQ